MDRFPFADDLTLTSLLSKIIKDPLSPFPLYLLLVLLLFILFPLLILLPLLPFLPLLFLYMLTVLECVPFLFFFLWTLCGDIFHLGVNTIEIGLFNSCLLLEEKEFTILEFLLIFIIGSFLHIFSGMENGPSSSTAQILRLSPFVAFMEIRNSSSKGFVMGHFV